MQNRTFCSTFSVKNSAHIRIGCFCPCNTGIAVDPQKVRRSCPSSRRPSTGPDPAVTSASLFTATAPTVLDLAATQTQCERLFVSDRLTRASIFLVRSQSTSASSLCPCTS